MPFNFPDEKVIFVDLCTLSSIKNLVFWNFSVWKLIRTLSQRERQGYTNTVFVWKSYQNSMHQAQFFSCPPNKISPCRLRNFSVFKCLFKSFGSLQSQILGSLVGLFFSLLLFPFFFSSVSVTCRHLTFSELFRCSLKVAAMCLGCKMVGCFHSSLYSIYRALPKV